jgi:hypothetical protein
VNIGEALERGPIPIPTKHQPKDYTMTKTLKDLIKFTHTNPEGHEISVLDAGAMFDGPIAKDIWGKLDPYSNAGADAFKEFCKVHGIYYYAAPREHFDVAAAYQTAHQSGAHFLVMEDLS